jgi:hypothetical protein
VVMIAGSVLDPNTRMSRHRPANMVVKLCRPMEECPGTNSLTPRLADMRTSDDLIYYTFLDNGAFVRSEA